MKKKIFIAAILFLVLFAEACVRLEGGFAIRRYNEETYRKRVTPFECAVAEEVQWAFLFDKVTRRHDIAVIIQKKEIGWVESRSWSDYISREKSAVHGTIKDFEPGEYQIMILQVKENNKVLGTLGFFVYAKAGAES